MDFPPTLEKPFPKRQILVLCICRFAEPTCLTIIFPFVYYMVRDFHVTDDPVKIGYYVGYIAACFAAAQFFTGIPWGILSDNIGRRPVALFGLIGTITSILLFGLSESYIWAVLSRSLCGILNGNTGVISTMLGEMTVDLRDDQRVAAFGVMPLMYGLGSVLGPALGGFLSHPVQNYPDVFGGRGWLTRFLTRFPYFLPCFVSACICAVGLVVGIFFLEETLETKRKEKNVSIIGRRHVDRERMPLMSGKTIVESPESREAEYHTFPGPKSNSQAVVYPIHTAASSSRSPPPTPIIATLALDTTPPHPSPPKPTFRSILTRPVLISVTTFAGICLQFLMFEELYSIWVATPPTSGGLGLPTTDIGLSLSAAGIMHIIMQLLLWRPLQRRLGTLAAYRFGLALSVPTYFFVSFLRTFVDDRPLLWAGLMFFLGIKTLCSMLAFTCSLLIINDSAPSHGTLGTVNGFATCVASAMRTVGPAACGTMYSWALGETRLPWIVRVHFAWAVLSLVAVGSWWSSLFIRKWGNERVVVGVNSNKGGIDAEDGVDCDSNEVL